MTVSQKRAKNLAVRILQDHAYADQLNDHDWTLLLLAAGMNSVSIPPQNVAARVIAALRDGTGYFKCESLMHLRPKVET